MNKKQLILVLALLLIPISSYAAKDYLVDKGHEPDEPTLHEYKIDLDGDRKPELVKIRYDTNNPY